MAGISTGGRFTVDEDTTFSIFGSLTGTTGGGNSTFQFARLIDITPGIQTDRVIFRAINNVWPSGDFSLPLNGAGEAMTGTLTAGHTYDWLFQDYIYFGDTGISATGGTTLTIGDGGGAPVPDGGATLALLSVGLVGLVLLRRKLAM